MKTKIKDKDIFRFVLREIIESEHKNSLTGIVLQPFQNQTSFNKEEVELIILRSIALCTTSNLKKTFGENEK